MASSKQKQGPHSKAYAAVHAFALTFPEAYEEFPWGHSAIKVRKKIFISMGETDEGFSMSLKLTSSNFEALLLPFTEPTHYGMGKHGWVSSRFAPRARPPLALLKAWIEESYRAIAPKGLVAQLDADGPVGAAAGKKAPARAAPVKKKASGKKASVRPATRKAAAKPVGKKSSKKATKKAAKKSSKKASSRKKA